MRTNKLMIMGMLVLLACFTIGPSFVFAQDGLVFPVNEQDGTPLYDQNGDPLYGDPPPGEAITLAIIESPADGPDDLTDGWLPRPGKEFLIHVNNIERIDSIDGGVTDGVTLSSFPENPEITTSAYPGVCTNIGDPGDEDYLALDFDPPVITSSNAFKITCNDNGGRAVLRITGTDLNSDPFSKLFIVPADWDLDGMADDYERQFCTQDPDALLTCLDPEEDYDVGPALETDIGDNAAAIDEYRGFRVSGQYIHTNPKVKDIFFNFLEEPQCLDEALLYDDPDNPINPISLATFYDKDHTRPYDDPDFKSLFTNASTLIPDIFIHRIERNEWVDNFLMYTDEGGVIYKDDSGAVAQNQNDSAIRDRQINQNALMPKGREDTTSGMCIMKGLRLIQCLKTNVSCYGLSPKRPPDGFEIGNGTAVIYPQSIWKDLKSKFVVGSEWPIKYYTFKDRKWREIIEFDDPYPTTIGASFEDFWASEGVRFITKDALIPFYAVHELFGHGLDLTTTIEGTEDNPVGYHHVAGTGTNIDVRIVHVVKRGNKFYIPTYFGDSDKINMHLSEQVQP